jgi:hypothetical protein
MQITSLYGGPLEFLFVVESTDDPAYHAISRLISEFEVYTSPHFPHLHIHVLIIVLQP